MLESLTTPPQGTAASPPTPDGPIPDPLLSITDLNLEQTGMTLVTPAGDLGAEYTLTADWVVNFGPRELDLDGDGTATTSDLLLTIPTGTHFLAEYVGPGEIPPIDPPAGPIVLEFEAFANGDGFFTHDGATYDLTGFVLDAESLNNPAINIGDWAFEAESNNFGGIDQPGIGEAFSYAESTAALDLNGDGTI